MAIEHHARARRILRDIDASAWEHPADKAALQAARRIPVFDYVLRTLFGIFGEKPIRLAFQANAVIGNFTRARGIGVVNGVDFQNSGRVEKILKEPLQQILDQGMIPIFPCIGWNAAGKPYEKESHA